MPGELVLGYDGSECANAALERALDLAGELGTSVVAVFGYQPGSALGEEFGAHADALREVGERVAQTAVEKARARGASLEVDIRGERPVEALLGVAEERDARMIVVGSYGEGPIKGAILGSTPHKLLHLSERPVLVVPV